MSKKVITSLTITGQGKAKPINVDGLEEVNSWINSFLNSEQEAILHDNGTLEMSKDQVVTATFSDVGDAYL